MEIRAKKDSQGNVVGIETVNDEGVVISSASRGQSVPGANSSGRVVPDTNLPRTRGDFRTTAQRNSDAKRAESGGSGEEDGYVVPQSVLRSASDAPSDASEQPSNRPVTSERPASEDVMGPAFTGNTNYNRSRVEDDTLAATAERGGLRGVGARFQQGLKNVGRGVIDAVEDVTDFSAAVIDTVRGVEVNDEDNLFNPSARISDPTSAVGKFTQEAVSFGVTSLAVGGLASKIPAVAKMAQGGWKARTVYSAGVGAATDFIKAKPAEENIFNSVKGTFLESPISNFLAASEDEEANLFLEKAKAAVGGIPLGIGFDLFGEGVTQAAKAARFEPLEKLLVGIRNAKKLPDDQQEAALRAVDDSIRESLEASDKLIREGIEAQTKERITEARKLLKQVASEEVTETVNPAIPTFDVDSMQGSPTVPVTQVGNVERIQAVEEELLKLSDLRLGIFEAGAAGNGRTSGVDLTELDETIFNLQDELDALVTTSNSIDVPTTTTTTPGVPSEEAFGGYSFKPQFEDDELVTVDLERVFSDWQANGDTDLIDGRLENIKGVLDELKETGEPLTAPLLTFKRGRGFDIDDGRTRITELRNRGVKQIQAVVKDLDALSDSTKSFDASDYAVTKPPAPSPEPSNVPTELLPTPAASTVYRTKPEIRRDIAVKTVTQRLAKENADKAATAGSQLKPRPLNANTARAISLSPDDLRNRLMDIKSNKPVDTFVNLDKLTDSEDAREAIEVVMQSISNNKLEDTLTDAELNAKASSLVKGLKFLGDDKEASSILEAYAGFTSNVPVAQRAIRILASDMAEQVSTAAKALSTGKKFAKLSIPEMTADVDFMHKLSRFEYFLTLNKNLGKVQAQGLRARGVALSGEAIEASAKQSEYLRTYGAAAEQTAKPEEFQEGLLELLKTESGRKRFDKIKTDIANAKGVEELASAVKVSKFATFGQNVEKLIQGVRMNSILSGTRSNLTNVVSNGTMSLYVPATRIAGATLDAAYNTLRGNKEAIKVDVQTIQQSLSMYAGLIQYFGDASTMASKAFKTGKGIIGEDQVLKEADQLDLLNPDTGNAVINGLAKAISLPSRLLLTGDEFFKQLNYRSWVRAQGIQDGLAKGLKGKRLDDYVSKMVDDSFHVDPETGIKGLGIDPRAKEYSEFVTFQSEINAKTSRTRNAAVSMVETLRNLDVPGAKTMTSLFVPFIKTPANVLAYTGRNSPLGLLSKSWQADFAAGGAKRAQALGEAAIGSTAMMGIISLALNGKLTGRAPRDPGQREQWFAQGYQPYSIKLGNKYVSFERMEPFAGHFAIISDVVDAASKIDDDGAAELGEVMQYTLGAFVAAVRNRSYFEGLTDLTEIINSIGSDDPRDINKISTVSQQIALTLAPYSSFLNEQRRARDMTLRETNTFVDKLMNRIPGMSDSLPARRNWLTGKPVTYGSNPVLNLYPSSYIQDDPVIANLLKYNVPLTPPNKNIKGVDLSAEQYSQLLELSGNIKIAGKTQYEAIKEVFEGFDTTALDMERDYIQANEEYARSTPLYKAVNKVRSKYAKASEAALVQLNPELVEPIRQKLVEKGNVKEGMSWLNQPAFSNVQTTVEEDASINERIQAVQKSTDKSLETLIEGPGIPTVEVVE